MSEAAVSSVLGSVGSLAIKETTFLCGVSGEVELLKEELMRLQAYLKDADNKRRSGNERVGTLVAQIRDAAYDIQNVIEAADYVERRKKMKKGVMGAISRYATKSQELYTLHKVGNDIQRIRRKLNEIFASAEKLGIRLLTDATVNASVEDECLQDYALIHQKTEDDTDMIGFQDDLQVIVNKLAEGARSLSAVSIAAMGGAGKTTLARKAYNSSTVKRHFKAVAWVTVSQKFKGRDLLNDILKQITGTKGNLEQISEEDLGKRIRSSLSRKRYLIALDDVWEENTWEQLNRVVLAFPNDNNGSRLLLTTRKLTVANHVEVPTYVHCLSGLDEEKSWDLFSSKAFPSHKRSSIDDISNFEELGRKLARKCGGLPLALAVLGGYLSQNISMATWLDVLSCWPSTKKTQIMRNILARSYFDMEEQFLRACFLYLAIFPEDRRISVPILITLWIAEGFIPHSRRRAPEETARLYVAELAQRCLVQVISRSEAHGWIEDIRVHDVLRDWCIDEAIKDGFLDVISGSSGQGSRPSQDMQLYRASYHNFSGPNIEVKTNLRGLFGFRFAQLSMPQLRFIRVIHIENSKLQSLSTAIESSIHLRCLRLVSCQGVTLASSIGSLLYLQTFDLSSTESIVPKSLWEIPSLRHVSLSYGFTPPKGKQLTELQTLWLRLPDAKPLENLGVISFLHQMTQLTSIWLTTYPTFSIPAEAMNMICQMPHLVDVHIDALSALDKWPESGLLPQNIRSFELSADAIAEDPMPVLEKLQYLVVLKLHGFTGRSMSCSAYGFPRLQKLMLKKWSKTEKWTIEVGAMPKLSYLSVSIFPLMRKMPEGLLHLPSLRHLGTVYWPLFDVYADKTVVILRQKGCEVICRDLSIMDAKLLAKG